nr:MAG TPA: hypothetical protein [Caudoviricetes sp.]
MKISLKSSLCTISNLLSLHQCVTQLPKLYVRVSNRIIKGS